MLLLLEVFPISTDQTGCSHFHETACTERFSQPMEGTVALVECSHLSSVPFERGSVTTYVPYLFLALCILSDRYTH
jgi:hypothetical protein